MKLLATRLPDRPTLKKPVGSWRAVISTPPGVAAGGGPAAATGVPLPAAGDSAETIDVRHRQPPRVPLTTLDGFTISEIPSDHV